MAAESGAGGFPLVFGLNTFGDTTDDDNGHRVSHAQAIRDVVEEGVFAGAGRGSPCVDGEWNFVSSSRPC